MTAASTLKVSIGRSLLVQLCVIELISIVFFKRVGADVLAGIIAPLWGMVVPLMAMADWSRLPSAPGWLLMGCVAVVLFAGGSLAWLRFGSRVSAHAAFALYSFWSMLLLLGLK